MLVMRPVRSSLEARRMVNEYMNRTYFSANGFKWGSSLYHRDKPDDRVGPMVGFIIVGDPLIFEHNDGKTVQILKCYVSEEAALKTVGLNQVKVASVLVAKAAEAANHIGFDRILGYCNVHKDASSGCQHFFRYM